MQKFTIHTGKTVALYQANIDTDQIVPKKFLLKIERTGYEAALFYDWRFNADGTPRPDFVLNKAKYKNASVLLAGANFGCGSSREHAPWALTQHGFRAVVAPSFADIFYNNALKNGLLPVSLSEDLVAELVEKSNCLANYGLTIDLENQMVTDAEDFRAAFVIEEFRRRCLLDGLDDIGLTLRHEAKISHYEAASRRGIIAGGGEV